MRQTYYIAAILMVLVTGDLFSQNSSTKKGDKYYDRLQYVKAIEEYRDLVSDGEGNAYIYKRLADSYYNLYNTAEAERYYGMYLDEAEDASGEAYYRYAQMLKANGKFDRSNEAMQEFASLSPNDERARAFLANPGYLPKILNGEAKFRVEELELNSSLSDFGGTEHEGGLYFVSARNQSRRNYGWNAQPTLEVYVAREVGGAYRDAELLEGDVNSKYHEGTVSVTQDGQTMYFTRNDYLDGDYNKSSEGIGQLKIYRAELVNGEWDDVQPLPFNDSEYSTGHPALSPDGKTLYFSSDMPGGSGMSDLYRISISEDGSFGDPENLGPGINTPGRESFPFVDKEGTLYFSSDGQLGIGGLDVFYAEADGDGFGTVHNLGRPVNSTGDDFAFTFDVPNEQGFVSSNRGGVEENAANDNIYRVVQIQPLGELIIASRVVDGATGEPIPGATVRVYDDQENEIATGTTTEDGSVELTVASKVDYAVQVNADDYESASEAVSKEARDRVELVVELDPIESIVREEEVVLNPIMFDFDRSNIRKQAAFELDKLVSVMEKYPEMKIRVESHTDKRGPESYNQVLSERRAQSTVQYVVSQGIDESRISGEGFGESRPKVECDPCSQEEYEQNRRSEFRIVKE